MKADLEGAGPDQPTEKASIGFSSEFCDELLPGFGNSKVVTVFEGETIMTLLPVGPFYPKEGGKTAIRQGEPSADAGTPPPSGALLG